LEETIIRAKCFYDQHKRNPTFQRYWEDKKKFKMEQSKKGKNPPFFRNSSQGEQTPRVPRMNQIGGKNTRKTRIQCWGCKGDHLYRECSHKKYKVRVFHDVQKYERLEGMGRSVPRIYASLENKQA
jgi:hypothetical protein